MDDPVFEAQLSRLFAEPRAFPDSQLFAIEIETRLGRGWALRRVLIFAAGVAGGLVAFGQMLGTGLLARIDGASRMLDAAREGLNHLPLGPQFSLITGDLPFGGEVIWLAVGLAVLAGALLVGRSVEDI